MGALSAAPIDGLYFCRQECVFGSMPVAVPQWEQWGRESPRAPARVRGGTLETLPPLRSFGLTYGNAVLPLVRGLTLPLLCLG